MNVFQDIGWYFRHRDLIGRVLSNEDNLALIDALKELGSGDPIDSTASLHSVLVEHGVDTRALAVAIHPVGPQPEGPGLGANV